MVGILTILILRPFFSLLLSGRRNQQRIYRYNFSSAFQRWKMMLILTKNSSHEFWAKGEQFKSFFFWAFYQQTFWTSRLTRVYVCQEIKFSWHLLWCWWHFGKFAKCLLLKLKSVNFLFRVVKLFENLVNSTCYNFKIVYIILTNFFSWSPKWENKDQSIAG